jgi:hypothetical protein
MSKKLIAVASAAALALTALVGIAPAHATPTITYGDVTAATSTNAGTAADPYEALVPQLNTINRVDTTGNALLIAITDITAGDSATVSSAGTAKVVGDAVTTSTKNLNVSTLGASTLTKTASGSSLNFYVYSTSSAANSTITVSVTKTAGGTKSTTTATKYFKANIGAAFAVKDIVVPNTTAAGAEAEVTYKVTDVFGNEIGAAGNTQASALTAAATTTDGIATYDTTRKLWVAEYIAPANTKPYTLTITHGSATADHEDKGLGKHSVADNIVVVNGVANATASSQVTNLTSQVAALTAQVAGMVTKKRFNKLARKWNKAFPSQKVALKK